MIPQSKQYYQSSEQWLDAFQNEDYLWRNKKKHLEEDCEKYGTRHFEEHRAEANKSIGEGNTERIWFYTKPDIKETVQRVWEEEDYSLLTLGVKVMGMLTINWLDEKLQQSATPHKLKKTPPCEDSIFIPSIDTDALREGIKKMWMVSHEGEMKLPKPFELLSHQNEWICFHKVFLENEWLVDTSRSQFVIQMQMWFGEKPKGKMLPCREDDLRKLDNYIKNTPASEWSMEGKERLKIADKLRELIFIYNYLKKEFTDERYNSTTSTY